VAGEVTAVDLQLFAAERYHAAIALEAIGRRAAAASDGLLAEQRPLRLTGRPRGIAARGVVVHGGG